MGDNDYLYVVTWDDGTVAESWLGEFEIDGRTVLTGADDWEYVVGGRNPYQIDRSRNLMPSTTELNSFISAALWQNTKSVGQNGVNPWGTIAGIDGEADWLQTASHTAGKYTIFRTRVPADNVAATPEPGSLLGLLAIGAVSSGAVMKRQRQA
ncbi:MAG: PEP-CTERM sorting domain-containing protein [Leptolyngbya sp. RL_3_1]|nr:PEP-CTERM sorting domain-containing protein [Leptolyngbya sp. RL_3_1]